LLCRHRTGNSDQVPVIIGTSGWQYADWRGRFYPRRLAQAHWLAHYAGRFVTVEVNSAFYRLPDPSTFERWRERTPDEFIFSVKASRYLTHIRRLKEPAEAVGRLMERADLLGPKLGPVLLQLPGNFRQDLGALKATLAGFRRDQRVVFEPRHESWFDERTANVLEDHNAALCLTDTANHRSPLWRTANWGYVRFHQGRANPSPCYGRTALRSWAERLAALWEADTDVFVYFNNDHGGCAVRDAHRFASAVTIAGLVATRVPSAREASLVER
jgi:uncharacterized protein YecE (DUF72 family)